MEELEGLDASAALCERFGLLPQAGGEVQKDAKSVDVVLLDAAPSALVGERINTLLGIPVGVLCRPGEHAPEGATLLYDAAALKDTLPERLGGYGLVFTGQETAEQIERAIKFASPRLILLRPESQEGVTFLARRFYTFLTSIEAAKAVPMMLWFSYPHVDGQDQDDVVIKASADFGSLFIDGLGEGLVWDAEDMTPNELREASFNLLQASRMRITKTEFISCPSCGRTLFNLQDTTRKIQERTGHLPGVRIAVMGCIVNGPGEMADADFGYVGSGVGKIDLYVNYDCVKRGVPQEDAVDGLVDLIKEHGRWVEPPEKNADVMQADKVPATA
jgi:(E)-4-hydroxy-3-methylbut-2-enyl-diphosphate synthase